MNRALLALPLLALAACGGEDITARWAGEPEPAKRLPAAPAAETEWSIDDFSIDIVVIEDKCYDSAGALMTIEPDVSIRGGSYDGQATLVYEVHGGGINDTFNVEIDGDRYSYDQELLDVDRCNVTLTATPVRLIER